MQDTKDLIPSIDRKKMGRGWRGGGRNKDGIKKGKEKRRKENEGREERSRGSKGSIF